jgi:hypothetical protein
MSQSKDLGVYLPNVKKFYYLEAGESWVGNTVDRVRKTLTQRGLIKITFDTSQKQMNYEVITLGEAKKRDYVLVPIYISKHIEQLYKTKDSDVKGAFK